MRNKFLEEIGYDDPCTISLFRGSKNDERRSRWKKQRKKYGGYDERITWSFNTWLLETIYTGLKLYLKCCHKRIDLSFHKFCIDGETLTQEECIKRILKDLRYILLKEDVVMSKEESAKIEKRRKDAFAILAEIFPVLWW